LSRPVSDFPLITASRKLAERLRPLAFTKAAYTYLPLDYARAPHEEYLRRFGTGGEEEQTKI
jgi:single-strand selective monofunctional uracil DNA glycosylase